MQINDDATPFANAYEEDRALLPGYSLGITTSDENERVKALLRKHPDLNAEVAAYRTLSEAMLASTSPVEPPAGALERLLAVTSADTPPVPVSGWEQVKQALFAPRLRLSPVAVAASLALVLGIVGYLTAQVNQLQAINVELLANTERQEMALALMRAQDVRWVKLPDPAGETEVSPYAWLVFSPGQKSGVLLANNFPQQSPDMAYQVWMGSDDHRLSLGLFQVDSNGTAAYMFDLPENLTDYSRMGITLEPATGSPGPTSPAVVRLDLTEHFERLNDT